ncbi:MAG: hypothetical protein LUD81_05635, partial [Clostridiales bacterium]|nr:hypothetical protein [Clostridiales bacterium]
MSEFKDENINNIQSDEIIDETVENGSEDTVLENINENSANTEEEISAEASAEETEAASQAEEEAPAALESSYYEEKSAALLKNEKSKKGHGRLKRFAAFAAGVAVVFCSINGGLSFGSYLYKNGGVAAASGSDISLGSGGARVGLPVQVIGINN